MRSGLTTRHERVRSLAVAFAVAGLAGCGDDATAPRTSTPEEVAVELCDRACGCSTPCGVGQRDPMSFEDRDACVVYFEPFLDSFSRDGSLDLARCDAELDTAMCVVAADGTTVLDVPVGCRISLSPDAGL